MMPTHDTQGPQMRAAQLQEGFNWVEALDPLPRVAILQRCAHVRDVRDLHRLGWIPLEYGVELTEAVHAVLGDAGLRAFGRESALSAGNRVWIKPFLDAALRIFGPTPRGVFRFWPRTWEAVFRNAGELRFVERGEHEGTLVLKGLQPLAATRSHLMTVSGCFAATMNLCRAHGHVELLPMNKGATTANFDVTWESRKSTDLQLR